jgi:uncharacterized protein YndB with AHSA1/START domain
MEQKTKVHADDGRQDLVITRDFDLPVELLFKAYAEPELIEQVMTNPHTTAKLLKFEAKNHGSYQLESSNAHGNVVFRANGTIHEFSPHRKITRTFEMENTPFGVQLEVYRFEPLPADTSRLNMHVIYESSAQRDEVLKLPFAKGLNMAHNRIEEIAGKMLNIK